MTAPRARALCLCLAVAFGGSLWSCTDSDPPAVADNNGSDTPLPPAESTAAIPAATNGTADNGRERVVALPFADSTIDLLVDDFDDDGRPDVALTSHRGNVLQVFYQTSPRAFVAGRLVKEVGFHPGNIIRLPRDEDPRYLVSAEGERRLFAMKRDDEGGLTVVSAMAVPYPRYSLPFTWPDWPNALAVATFSPASVVLLKGLDPVAGTFDRENAVRLPLKGTVLPLTSLAVADLDGDQADEILFATPETGAVWQVRYPLTGGLPNIEPLWENPTLGAVVHLVAYDLDQDGDLDVVAPAETSAVINGEVSDINLLMNQGDGSFRREVLPFKTRPAAEGGTAGVVAVATGTDRDGHVYLLAAGYEHLELFRLPRQGRPATAPSRRLPYSSADSPSALELRDLDDDGWLDAVLGRSIAGQGGLVIFGPLWDYFARADAELPAPPPRQF